jgi:hypothetical protein
LDGGAAQLQYVQTQRITLPSANSTVSCGVDQINIFFTVIREIDTPAIVSWEQLTSNEFAPGAAFTEGNGAIRCGIEMGFAGGPTAVNIQSGSGGSLNGFVGYGRVTSTGVTLQTDQLPVVGNFDNVSSIAPSFDNKGFC